MDNIPAGITAKTYPDYQHFIIRIEGWSGLYIRLFMTVFAVMAWVMFINHVRETSELTNVWAYVWRGLPLLLAVALSYVALAHWRNSTHILVSQDLLEIYQRPMWMPGYLRLDVKRIEQIYVRHNHRSRRGKIELRAKLKTQEDIRLLNVIYPLSHALYLERALEQHIGINNRRVVGEYDTTKGFLDP